LTAVRKDMGGEKTISVENRGLELSSSKQNICGYDKYIYVFDEENDTIQKIDVDTDERTEIDLMSGGNSGSIYSVHGMDFKAQCNDKYLLYTGERKYYVVNLETESTSLVKGARYWSSLRLVGDRIYYTKERECFFYDIATKKSKKLCEIPEEEEEFSYRIPLGVWDNCTLGYDDPVGEIYEGKLFVAGYNEEEDEHRYYVIDLETGKIEENTLEVEVDTTECASKVMKYGSMFYATESDEPMLVRFNMLTGESRVLEEDTLCVDSGTSGGLFRSSTYYAASEIKIVGKWLYYESSQDERIHRIPIEGGNHVVISRQ
ncbi:MAG: hypothetical protein ACI4C5_10155, partial [Lachnospiraceae bacterium]